MRAPRIENLVAPGSVVQGSLRCRGDVRVDGTVAGDLVCDGIAVVGESGAVEGAVEAESAVVAGSVAGHVTVRVEVELLRGGQVAGDVRAPKLSLGDGAVFDGRRPPPPAARGEHPD